MHEGISKTNEIGSMELIYNQEDVIRKYRQQTQQKISMEEKKEKDKQLRKNNGKRCMLDK